MSESELKKQRGSYKRRFTVFGNYLSPMKPSELTPCQVMELQLRTEKIESLYAEFDSVQLQLECMSETPEAEAAERSSVETQYFSLMAMAKYMINSFAKSDDCESKSSRSSNRNQLVKLPTIQLPKFTGLYDNWLEFRDTFSSLIHDNDNIDEINKFHYLRSSLEGSAAVVIQAIEFSSQNYKVAWDLLCERFDNKRLLIQNHVTALFNIDKISQESSSSLKRMIDTINKNIRALSTLGEPVDSWDTLLIHIISQKLDTKTFREWEECKGRFDKTTSISFSKFMEFLRNRADLIETLELSHNVTINRGSNAHANKNNHKLKAMVSLDNTNTSSSSTCCPRCSGNHHLNVCSQFLALSIAERLSALPSYKVCFNCFRRGHYSTNCKKSGCKICKRKHHTIIHCTDFKQKPSVDNAADRKNVHEQPKPETIPTPTSSNADVALAASISARSHTSSPSDVLLSTALVRCYDVHNKEYIARALLDSGSSSCLMTEKLCKQLNLPFTKVDRSICGINNSLSHIGKMCSVRIKSLSESHSFDLQCFVLPTITDNVPARQIDLRNLNIPIDLHLADPNFHTPAEIDLIIGADLFWSLLGSQKLSLGHKQPILYETRLGWLISGPINSGYNNMSNKSLMCNFTKVDIDQLSHRSRDVDDIQNQLTRFWQLEEVCHQSSTYSAEEQHCEDHFVKNTVRLGDGRFSVKIPLKESSEVLGDSLQRAKRCFLSIERRNQSQPSLNKMYKDFMSEYISLGHMSECVSDENKTNYFIPHHGVLRESSTTTKLRVVFNASAPTTSGISLNNIQMVGPTVQDDLLSILIRFRMYKYVLSADVEKMYRQVSVHPSDRHLQQIIWRDDSSSPLKVYELNTVTYGTASAPFLATRCLKQIGIECSDKEVSEVIIHDFYVDDLLTGTDQLDKALSLRDKISQALASACMPLRKWKSNEPALLFDSQTQSPVNLNIEGADLNKTLGLNWLTQSDELCFPINLPPKIDNTKRDMLAVIARVFDPLGLLAPCVIKLKILLQSLWLKRLAWDEQLPADVGTAWANIMNTISALSSLRIPRRVVCDFYKEMEMHIFTDASERAYGAAVYIRSVDKDGQVFVQLLMAKSRVSPIKPVTIPRLELCAALVGARIYEKIKGSLRIQASNVVFWTDSMIVLGWLKMLPVKLNTFVRNRVAEIIDKTDPYTWRHVPTNDNPADLLSRGVDANDMQSSNIWWSGPTFLQQDSCSWPCTPGSTDDLPELPELKMNVSLHINVDCENTNEGIIDFKRFSNFMRLQRTIAYVLRFINACRKKSNQTIHLSNDELQNALNLIIIQSQKESFPEYQLLKNNKNLPHKNQLLKWNVFLDENQIMRVGGRLQNSDYTFDKKNPILLQSTHYFTKLLFKFEHVKLLHAGPQLLLATIRETYWPLGGRNLAKMSYRQCIRCQRLKGQTLVPQMGNLPSSRLSPADYPFQNVGVDYAGPIMSASRQGRGCRLVKVYIAIFVCFTTKAVHLELVGDLTSQTFLMALRRFMSRRGKPLNIYSDNGTSFVGAYNEISNFLKSSCDSLSEQVASDGIKFHFIPVYAAHFGGIWEGSVKSTKFHLVRVLGNCKLTYEELNTTLVQIEAILNSRPLTPLSSDPEDLMPLTPAHFLVGRPLTSLPVQDIRDHSTHHLTRHQRVEQIRQHFWERWNKEYVSELQQRVKWHKNKDSLKLNSLVVIKEDNLPPLKWRLGRIVALHPGKDGISRVADIRTSTGVVRRAFPKICVLVEDFC